MQRTFGAQINSRHLHSAEKSTTPGVYQAKEETRSQEDRHGRHLGGKNAREIGVLMEKLIGNSYVFRFLAFWFQKKSYEMSGFLCFTFLPIEISRILINSLDICFILSRNFQSSLILKMLCWNAKDNEQCLVLFAGNPVSLPKLGGIQCRGKICVALKHSRSRKIDFLFG